jgi:hypothetical protein
LRFETRLSGNDRRSLDESAFMLPGPRDSRRNIRYGALGNPAKARPSGILLAHEQDLLEGEARP